MDLRAAHRRNFLGRVPPVIGQEKPEEAMGNGQVEMVFVATPGIGNHVPAVEFAQLLASHHPRFRSTILVITGPHRAIASSYVRSRAAAASSCAAGGSLRFVHLPLSDPPHPSEYQSPLAYLCLHIASHARLVKQALVHLRSTGAQVAALFLDMFTTPMAHVARELGIPHYLFFPSPASFLGFMLYLLDPEARKAVESEDMGTELAVPSFVNSVPKRVLPSSVLKWKDALAWSVAHAERYGGTEGIVVNTFEELSGHALESLRASVSPPVYSVGPFIDLAGPVESHPQRAQQEAVLRWLSRWCSSAWGAWGAWARLR